MGLIGEAYPFSRAVAAKRVEEWSQTSDSVSLAIVTKKGKCFIGTAGLIHIDTVHRRAELGILIGEEEYWSRGLGTEAINAILTYGFDRLNLNMVYLGVICTNERAIRCYERIGFSHDGVIREKYLIDGTYCDCIMMSLLQREWKQKREFDTVRK
jgi:RimJ/RimL family protein N-acetyltransferase